MLSRNKVAVPEGAAGTPPFWRGRKIDKVFVLVLLVLFISRYDSVMIRKRESKKPGLIKQTRLNLVL